ncbi:hypothetical protein FKM82_002916 [Ascaphus truei]
MRSGAEPVCGEGSFVSAALTEESVIVISDEEGDVTLGLGNSVLLIEEAGDESFDREKKTVEVLDEEIAITFSRKGNVMPHARYDCITYAFTRAEEETQLPLEENPSACAECYCYLCDKPASECPNWTTMSICHCNAHNKSKYWKEQRDCALAGVLTIFNLDLTEIDAELREGGNQLQKLIGELSVEYAQFLKGHMVNRETIYNCTCICHRKKITGKCNICPMHHTLVHIHSYSALFAMTTEYLNKAEKESPKAAAVMMLGAAKELVCHKVPPNAFALSDPSANLKDSTALLMARIIASVQRMMVLSNFPKTIYEKFVVFFQSLPLPPHCYALTNSLNVFRWDNLFLTSVLAGQNVTGQRTIKGKKEFLWESLPVAQARVQRLEEGTSYRQLVRYLNAVRCSDGTGLARLREKTPFYMCKYGDFGNAALLLLKGLSCSIAYRLTPSQFELYLTMFRTGSYPPGNELADKGLWIPYEGPAMKKGFLVRYAIRILYCNSILAQEPKCWSSLIRTWNINDTLTEDGQVCPLLLPQPNPHFQLTVLNLSCTILDELRRQAHAVLPDPFIKFPNASELILIVQAVVQLMMNTVAPLRSTVELVLAFGKNVWALSLLLDGIAPMENLLFSFITNLNKELHDEEQHVVAEWIKHGSCYVSQLVSLFVSQRSELARSVGFHILDMIIQNITRFSWTPYVATYLKSRILKDFQFTNPLELQTLQSKIGRLAAKS